jgi:ABC-type transport system involved in cytochrome c biogenesis permease subunit
LLAFAVWLVYALVLHARINPAFRGRKVAILSILGCVLMVGTLVVVNFVPGGGSGGGGSH